MPQRQLARVRAGTDAGTRNHTRALAYTGKYPYNTVVVPLMVEVLKFFMSAALLGRSWLGGDRPQVTMDALTFIKFAVPGLCYFISNNCTFVIIGELGATSFQVLTNLKVGNCWPACARAGASYARACMFVPSHTLRAHTLVCLVFPAASAAAPCTLRDVHSRTLASRRRFW